MTTGESSSTLTETSWSLTVLKTGLADSIFYYLFGFFIEYRFQLYYYSNAVIKMKTETILMIDTRVKKTTRNKNYTEDFDDADEDPLEKAVQTK